MAVTAAVSEGEEPRAALQDATHLFDEAERAMELCEERWLRLGDNFVLLLLDAAWSSLLLHTGGSLLLTEGSTALLPVGGDPLEWHAAARRRVDRARDLLHALHGPRLERLAALEDAGAQRAVWVRVHLLQGALAYYRGDFDDARSLLRRGDTLFRELTLGPGDDAKLMELLEMGFEAHEAGAALLSCGKDVSRSAARIVERRAAEVRERAERRQRRNEQRELRSFGRTPSGKLVHLRALNSLSDMGYPRPLAAEALRLADNDPDAALTTLSSRASQEELQIALCERQSAREADRASVAERAAHVDTMCAMGFERDAACRALDRARNDVTAAITALTSGARLDEAGPTSGSAPAAASAPASSAAADAAEAEEEEGLGRESWREDLGIEESGLGDAVAASERTYEAASLQAEGAAIQVYLAAVAMALV